MASASSAAASLYDVLGVHRNASEKDIRRAYKALALKLHPDLNKAPDATARFQQLSAAYEVLSDTDKRRHYDLLTRDAGDSASGSTRWTRPTRSPAAAAAPPPREPKPSRPYTCDGPDRPMPTRKHKPTIDANYILGIDPNEWYEGRATRAFLPVLRRCTEPSCSCLGRGHIRDQVPATNFEFEKAAHHSRGIYTSPASLAPGDLWGTLQRHYEYLLAEVRRTSAESYVDKANGARWSFREQTSETHPDDLELVLDVTRDQIDALRRGAGSVRVPRFGEHEAFLIHACTDAGFVRPIAGRGVSASGTLYVSLNIV